MGGVRIIVISALLIAAGVTAGVVLGLRRGASPSAPPARAARDLPGVELAGRFRARAAITTAATVADGRAYFGCDDGSVYCIRVADRKEVWSFKAAGGIGAAPLVSEGHVFVGSRDFKMYCLDANTGRTLWSFTTGGQVVGGAAAMSADGVQRIIFGSYDHNLYCLDANGSQVWEYATGDYVNSRPVIADGRAIFGGCDTELHVVDIATGKGPPSVPLGGEVASEAVIDGSLLYVGHYRNEFLCIDLETMAVRWRHQAGPVLTGAALDGAARLVFGSQDNQVYCVDRFGGAEQWRYDAGGWVDYTPVIDGGHVYGVTVDGAFFILSLESGLPLAGRQLPARVSAAVTLAGDLILVPCDDGYLYCLRRPRQP